MKTEDSSRNSVPKVAFASFVGTTIEWYDFFLYTYATAIVFVPVFFPNMQNEPGKALLYALGINLTGFLARPIGALVCGHFGDRIGRKKMLVFTLGVIGGATFLIGCLPSYETIGIWAPILLVVLRLAQGFAVGGEWGGAVLMSVEHNSGNRGFWGSYPQMGVPVGMFLATTVFIIYSNINEELLINKGVWRIGFLLSVILLFVGLYIRKNLKETEPFTESEEKFKTPIIEVFRRQPKNIFLAAGAKLVENAAFYTYTTFLLIINAQYKLYEKTTVLTAIAIASLLGFLTVPIFGWASDLVGRKKVYIAGTVFTALFAFPFFYLFQTRDRLFMTIAIIIALSIGHALMYGPQASFFAELFDTKVRYSGTSMGYQIASIFGGGLFPMLALKFLESTNSSTYIAFCLISMAIISTCSVLCVAEGYRKNIDSDPEDTLKESENKYSIVPSPNVSAAK